MRRPRQPKRHGSIRKKRLSIRIPGVRPYDKARIHIALALGSRVVWAGCARQPRRSDDDIVGVRVSWNESELCAAVKRAGGISRPRERLWELSWAAVRALDLNARVVEDPSKTKRDPNI